MSPELRREAIRLIGILSTLLTLLPLGHYSRARASFRAGLIGRRGRDHEGSPYLTKGDSEAAYTARTLEGIEVVAGDLAGLDPAGDELAALLERDASPRFRCVFGPLHPDSTRVDRQRLAHPEYWIAAIARQASESYDGETGHLDPFPIMVLHDALYEADCVHEVLLAHLRNQRCHHPACWAIDLVRSVD